MRKTVLLLFLLTNAVLWGQDGTDSTYIKTYSEELQILPSIRYVRSEISIQANQNTSLEFLQGATVFGTRLQFDKWGIGLSVPTKLGSGKTNSSSFGLQLQLFPKSLMINARASRMKGFEKVDQLNNHQDDFYASAKDIRLLHLSLNPIYAFSKDKYSLRAALQGTERQLKSQGSFLAALRAEYLRLKTNQNIIEDNQLNNALTDYSFRQNGLEGGYAYTQVIANHLIFSAIWLGGVAHTRTGYQQDQAKYHFKKWQINPISQLTLSAGYQSDRYVSSLRFNYQRRSLQSGDVQMEADGLSVQFVLGLRLHNPKLRSVINGTTKSLAQQFFPAKY
jgi:hypothetical protein